MEKKPGMFEEKAPGPIPGIDEEDHPFFFEKIVLNGKEIFGYIIPIGEVNLVFARTMRGIVGCGAIDVIALEKFGIPAVKVRPVDGDSIRNIDDLLEGEVTIVNAFARDAGVFQKMNGEEAIIKLG